MAAATDLVRGSAPIVRGLPYRALRAVYHAVRNAPDRILRGPRHRRAIATVRALGTPRTIFVVCLGNVCRSPYLAAVLQRALPHVDVRSAGFIGAGRPVPEASREEAARRGLDLSSFRSGPIHAAFARSSDLVIVMDVEQRTRLVRLAGVERSRIVIAGDLDPLPAPRRAIFDPWKHGADVFAETFDRLDRCAESIVANLLPAPRSGATGDSALRR